MSCCRETGVGMCNHRAGDEDKTLIRELVAALADRDCEWAVPCERRLLTPELHLDGDKVCASCTALAHAAEAGYTDA